MMSRARGWVGIVLGAASVVVVTACGSSTPSGTAGLASVYCAKVEPCCAQASLPTNGESCKALFSSLTAGGNVDSSAVDACMAAIQAEPQDQFCQDFGGKLTACSNAVAPSGTTAPGGSCELDTDCSTPSNGSATCVITGGSSGICVAELPGVVGSTPCNGTTAPLDSGGTFTSYVNVTSTPATTSFLCDTTKGTFCDPTTVTCLAAKASGDTCDEDMECATGDTCGLASEDSETETCVASAPLGAPCAAFTECVSTGYCAAGTCVALLAPGAACTDDSSCSSGTCSAAVCASASAGALTLYCGGATN